MDKNAIKKYAVWARRELIERVSQRSMIYGITAKDAGDPNAESVNGHLLSQAEKRQRQAVIQNIKKKGYEMVMEEVAYTWFNRFVALRFMEVNGYLPSHIRVFTNDAGEFKPQILAEAIHLELDGLDMNKVYELENANKSEELFKYLLIVQCNALNSILPRMFQRIEDYTELLLPDYLLREGSVIDRLISDIPEDNFDVRTGGGNGQVEIIGWLYQYYISEKHEEVIDPLHGKVIKKEEVPAATQLFTTDWVVRYLIDNSLGRYWLERNPNSTLSDKLTYLVMPKNGKFKYVNETITPQDLSTLDPCVGSGHFLVYAFDVLMEIYKEYGYSEREATAEIVRNNLYGLDIDSRAVQLAYFAIMMKARQYDRRFFSRGIQPNVYEIMESNTVDRASIEYFYKDDIFLKEDIDAILNTFMDAKEYGSILQIPSVDFKKIDERFAQLDNEISIYNTYLLSDFLALIRPAAVMSRKYAVVATNPPYMNKYDSNLKKFISDNYSDYKGDLFSVFMYRNFEFCLPRGYTGFMTPMVWMFIQSYEKLRKHIILNKGIVSVIQMEYSAYEEATVPICSVVFRNDKPNSDALCFRLSDFRGGMTVQKDKVLEAISNPSCGYFFESAQKEYLKVPGSPISYWWSNYSIFDEEKVGTYYESAGRNKTHGNNIYVRCWWEISDTVRWQPYANGGDFRRWRGNDNDFVDWSNQAKEWYASHGGLYNQKYAGKRGVCWNLITSYKNGFRIKHPHHHYSSAAPTVIATGENYDDYLLAFLNSCVSETILKMYNPTLNTTVGDVLGLPLIIDRVSEIEDISIKAQKISQADWDAFETSLDFKKHPLLCHVSTIREAFEQWRQECDQRFGQLKSYEEELNSIFIDIYGLQDVLTPTVEERDITVRKADLQRDIRSFISYAVGCMFGRYSLDALGLTYPGSLWDLAKYTTFQPDLDAIIPICDDEYFEDDIVNRFVIFVEKAYGKETLEENLQFIASVLGGKGSSRDVIRNYFNNGFYADHLKMYQKRPIYWLFDSGKKNGFKCLIYMHRYQPDTVARIRTDYVHEQQSRYRTAIANLEQRMNGASTSERVKLNKQFSHLQAQATEIREYEEKIHHLADQMIKIDLNEGVKNNYEIFKDVLAKIR